MERINQVKQFDSDQDAINYAQYTSKKEISSILSKLNVHIETEVEFINTIDLIYFTENCFRNKNINDKEIIDEFNLIKINVISIYKFLRSGQHYSVRSK